MSIEQLLLRVVAIGMAAFLSLGPMRAGSMCGSSSSGSGSNCLDGKVPPAPAGSTCDPSTQYLSTDGVTCVNYSGPGGACPTGATLQNGHCVSTANKL